MHKFFSGVAIFFLVINLLNFTVQEIYGTYSLMQIEGFWALLNPLTILRNVITWLMSSITWVCVPLQILFFALAVSTDKTRKKTKNGLS